ncbi:hypothetical protein CANARDRAFT_193178 [[Candida] arabinofermentans NRRL YB-2248]|uniref:Tyrosine-protein phosphatase OCA6 n=1 Tax=[Candida] arabinofermentans NRRL YB-2248 TaxID=983967 RepID=A0A1E4T8A4_9ASCO|nr:hypothetical protein CANARDRAFT_193178 [[Candida] arabinofermentans NRRL YB-2248]
MPSSHQRIPEAFIPPIKFSKIQSNVFRGAYPRPINYPYIKTLHLKTMIALMPDEITMENDPSLYSFCSKNNINLIHIEINNSTKDKGKKRGIPIEQEQVLKILEIVLDKDNDPTFIFCVNGGQITSLVIACLRKLQFWSSVSIYNEFVNYSSTINHNDRIFIENFKAKLKLPRNDKRVDWIWNGLSSKMIETHPNMKFIKYDTELKEDAIKF